ncbi:Export protein for polysaccharides and teichoic acids [Bacillus thuringiensis serovar israelensis ATCC 35646]|nr:Export protein for polysaccharides and teichoic acids [Bacillus thuringiensis serovar israelensis ATCC 35646]
MLEIDPEDGENHFTVLCSLLCILFSLFTVTAAMLQGINQQQKTVLGLVIGIIVKIVLNIVLLPYFDYVSFIISTYAGYTISVGFNLWMLSKYVIKAT